MTSIKKISFLILSVVILTSCNDDYSHIQTHKEPRAEYAPNMYHSEAYEPLTQITDSSKYGVEYNSNPYNPYRMNMRMPVPGTIKRNTVGTLPFYDDPKRFKEMPYPYGKDSLDQAAAALKNPFDTSVVKQGEVLYKKFCMHCHGETGQGDGEVGKKLGGVPQYNSQRLKGVSEGYIFHVITHGKGRMGPHASIVSQEERWKIVRYVQTLQALETEQK
ncbi:MAG: cytochrome c [Cytophagaceae bacterium]|nr:cytochrome c [Cytophagaceae bacterium]